MCEQEDVQAELLGSGSVLHSQQHRIAAATWLNPLSLWQERSQPPGHPPRHSEYEVQAILPNHHRENLKIPARSGNRYPNPCDQDRKSTRLNSSHVSISYAVFCLKKKK